MTSSKYPEEWSILLNALADDRLTAEQERRFVDLLRSEAEFRREYVRFCQLLTQLQWKASAVSGQQLVEETGETRTDVELQTRLDPTARLNSRRSYLAVVGIVAAFALIGFLWLMFAPGDPTSPEMVAAGHVTAVHGQISILREGQAAVELRTESTGELPWPLATNNQIRVGFGSSGTLTLADGTRLELRPETDIGLKVGSDVTVELLAGSLRAEVAKQSPGESLKFVTQRVNVNVLGTVLELLTHGEVDEVAVEEGLVRVSRQGDAQTTNVAAGQSLVVPDVGELTLIDWPVPAAEWVENFERGLPPDWIGRPVNDDLPEDSKVGVKGVAVRDVHRPRREIRSPLMTEGLFAWKSDSVLQLTYRVEPPGWFHIYLLARTYDDPQPVMTYCCVKPELWRQRPGDWQTATIPLSEFRRTDANRDEPTLGRIPLQISFSGPAGLESVVVDRIEVHRDTLPRDVRIHANASE